MGTIMQLSQSAQLRSATSNPIRKILLLNVLVNYVVQINHMSRVASSLKHSHNMNVLFTKDDTESKRPIQYRLRRIGILLAIMIVRKVSPLILILLLV